MSSSAFVYGAKQEANTARAESRSDIISYGRQAYFRFGRVTALQGGGAVQVTLLDDTGADGDVVNYVHTIPAATHEIDAIVWLAFWDGNPLPVIFGGTGGGSGDITGFFMSVHDLGYYGTLR